jgi:hypothetical protein
LWNIIRLCEKKPLLGLNFWTLRFTPDKTSDEIKNQILSNNSFSFEIIALLLSSLQNQVKVWQFFKKISKFGWIFLKKTFKLQNFVQLEIYIVLSMYKNLENRLTLTHVIIRCHQRSWIIKLFDDYEGFDAERHAPSNLPLYLHLRKLTLVCFAFIYRQVLCLLLFPMDGTPTMDGTLPQLDWSPSEIRLSELSKLIKFWTEYYWLRMSKYHSRTFQSKTHSI